MTPTKLVLATDIIKKATDYPVAFFPGCIDAEIECLELISIFPIELVSLSIFRRRRRKVLKAKFHDGNPNHNSKIVYFELGGSDKRKVSKFFKLFFFLKINFYLAELGKGCLKG